MTIYKPKNGDRKAEKKESSTKVVIPEDVQPLAARPKKKVDAPVSVLVVPAQRRRHGAVVLCLILLVVMVILVMAVGGYFLYNYLMTRKLYHETAEVTYYEYQMVDGSNVAQRHRIGTFTEDIEFEVGNGAYERLDVPPILESRRSTVVHDFEKNFTAIVDRDNKRCFVMPLNRTAVKPPNSFLDLLIKYKTGYYVPNADVVRENFKVQIPAVDDLEPFGFYIWYDCRWYNTYRLVPDSTTPRIMSKRSACEMAGDSYCLGDAGSDKMLCFTVTGCA